MRSTYTYAVLDISEDAYREIRAALAKVGYDHAFHKATINGVACEVIDMHGIAVRAAQPEQAGEKSI